MRKKGKRQSHQSTDVLRGMALGLLGIALLAGMGFAYRWALTQPDPAASCAKGFPTAVHAVVLDHSDSITGQQGQHIRQAFQRIKDGAQAGTRFHIFASTANTTDVLPALLAVCVPKLPSSANPLIASQKLMRKEFDEQFSQIVDKALTDLLTRKPQPSSPILESLHAATQTAFGPYKDGEVPMRLTFVSDMIQNSPSGSQFREEPNFERLSRQPAWPSLRPRLKGAHVNLLYILRPDAKRGIAQIQSRSHQQFWEQVLAASGGVVDSIEPF